MEVSSSASIPGRPKEFIDGCLDTWETGGKNQVQEALLNGLHLLSLPSKTNQNLLPALLYVLLCRHAFRSQLPPSTLAALFQQVLNSTKRDEEPKASSSRDPSPASSNSDTTYSSPLADILLDVIWSIDYEIDSRKDVAIQAKSTSLFDGEDGKAEQGTLEEQVSASKARLVDLVRELLSQEILTRRSVSERLEFPLLAKIGLIDDVNLFNRKGVRINTATLYKQQKFNLLREENEGYSGLVNEIVDGMGPSIRAVRGGPGNQDRVVEQESAEERNARARRVMNNISALIGYFDLDPNRVLDIILDIFSSNVVQHWPFYLALLVASPWGKGKGKASIRETKAKGAMEVDVSDEDKFGPIDISIKLDQGHDIIAQVLGFKFGHYQQDEVTERIPEELYLMAAILIREGHVRFIDLYSHLSPDEKGMTALHEKYKQSMSDKVMSAKGNALSLAAPLTEEGAGLSQGGANGKNDSSAGGQGNVQHDLPNQILGLLKALLGIGELRCALFILGRYPWLCGAYPQVADLYSRILIVILEPAYSTISIKSQIPVASNPSISVAKLRFDSKRQELVQISTPTNRVTCLAPEPQATITNHFIYFYGPWRENLPRCSVHGLLGEFIPLLRVLGPHLYRNQVLFQQICRLSRVALRTAANQAGDQSAWLEVVRNIILPALTMTSGNSGLVSEVWVVLRQLPYTTRYNLYGEWKYALYKRPELRARQAETEKEAKGILKRISSDNVKLSGRSLAKSSHTNPTIFFTVALNQIQSYSNLIAPIVESAKYLTHFEYDVFGFNLIDALSNPEKERTKQDGTSVSMWLQSLAAFTGTLYRRYAMMDCSPVLQYIANQLKENNSKDLVIIRELILKMAGIEPLANLSDSQVAALTGGRQLRMEAMMIANANIATPTRVALRKSGARLLLVLTESRMAIPLLILIAQQRQACIHLVDSGEAHLKYLGNLFDTCQEILFQYVEFLHNQLEPQAYSDLVPKLNDLCSRFEMEPAIAFHIARPRLVMNLRAVEAKEREDQLRKEVLASKSQNATKATAAIEEEKEQADEIMKDATTTEETSDEKKDVEMAEGEPELASTAPEPAKLEVLKQESEKEAKVNGERVDGIVWKAGLQEAIEAAENILQDETKDLIDIHFYATFWQLSLADIAVPTERYEQEIRALQQIIDKNPEGGRKSNHKARVQAQEMSSLLRSELKEQTVYHTATRKRLQLEKDHWIPNRHGQISAGYRQSVVFELMQHCFIPRALLSPTDALFAGRFLRSMHSAGTRNFSSLTAYDKIVTDGVAPLVFSCTENEIRNYARFLQIILTDLNIWYKDENRYIKEAYGDNLPGFQMKWAERRGGEAIPKEDLLGFDKFQFVMHKWHGTLRSIFRECLQSKEYMRIRNTIVIMTRIANQFPLWENHGTELLDAIKTMTQVEDRGDLKILGQGLLATLKKEQKNWIVIKKKAVVADVAATSSIKKDAVVKDAPSFDSTTSKTDLSAISTVKGEESKSAIADKIIDNKTSNREPGEASPVRDSSRKPSIARDSTPSATVGRGAASTGSSSAPSPSVLAARQAALESRNNSSNNGMNPPRTVASTASAQASRDRQANSQREVSSSNRVREKEMGRSQSQLSSRETSPRGGTETSDTRKNSRAGGRAGSEEGASKSSRSDRDRDREREKDRDRDQERERDREREKDRSSSGRRERDGKDRHSSREERDKDRSLRDRDGRSDRSLDDRSRDFDRLKPAEGKTENDTRPLPTGPRLATDGDRRTSDYNRDRRESRDTGRNVSSSSQQAPPPKEPASNRNNREILPKVEAEIKEDNGGRSPASMAKKRSLADRLASNNGEESSPVPSTKQDETKRTDGEEPNKRPRINRNRFTEEDLLSSKEDKSRTVDASSTNNSRSSREPSAAVVAPSTQGISIQGQGRSSGPPQYNRRDSRNTNYGRGGHDSNHHNREDYQHQDRDRNQASRNGSGSHRGNDRGSHGKERDQRRKERRSGQD